MTPPTSGLDINIKHTHLPIPCVRTTYHVPHLEQFIAPFMATSSALRRFHLNLLVLRGKLQKEQKKMICWFSLFSDLRASDSDAANQDDVATSEPEESTDDDGIEQGSSAGSTIINLSCPQNQWSRSSVCLSRRPGELKLEEAERQGLATELRLVCDRCGAVTRGGMAKRTSQAKYFDINERSVLAMRVTGLASGALTKICDILDHSPPVSRHSFLEHSTQHHEAPKQNCP